ncbi:hypothetical protein [Burkholderia vietnamiensis]|uniref:hypothetical protein n=2 Tax=Burkholderia vietnamiensis TaxID=60552 RepID=UPI00158F5ABC|nr:hypothetical protein [Burkholderia vietnamiensis]
MLRKFIGTEDCKVCIGQSNEWYLRTGEIKDLIFFGEVQDKKETSQYCFDLSEESFYFVQQQGKNPILTTEPPTNQLEKFQFVEVVDLEDTIIFEMENRGRIIFKELKK